VCIVGSCGEMDLIFFYVYKDDIFASACCRLTKISMEELGKYGIEGMCKGNRNCLKDTSAGIYARENPDLYLSICQ